MIRIFSRTANQAKKTTFISLIPLNTSPREMSTNVRNKDIVVRFDFKHPSLGRYPTKLVFASLSQSETIQQTEERGKGIHLLVVSHSKKVNILLKRVTRSIFTINQTKQVRKSCLEGLIPTPHIMPKYNFGTLLKLHPPHTLQPPSIMPFSHEHKAKATSPKEFG
jgi:hypothetical protein